jgi:hypothetical protein
MPDITPDAAIEYLCPLCATLVATSKPDLPEPAGNYTFCPAPKCLRVLRYATSTGLIAVADRLDPVDETTVPLRVLNMIDAHRDEIRAHEAKRADVPLIKL